MTDFPEGLIRLGPTVQLASSGFFFWLGKSYNASIELKHGADVTRLGFDVAWFLFYIPCL